MRDVVVLAYVVVVSVALLFGLEAIGARGSLVSTISVAGAIGSLLVLRRLRNRISPPPAPDAAVDEPATAHARIAAEINQRSLGSLLRTDIPFLVVVALCVAWTIACVVCVVVFRLWVLVPSVVATWIAPLIVGMTVRSRTARRLASGR